jgi:hypothetical protein
MNAFSAGLVLSYFDFFFHFVNSKR